MSSSLKNQATWQVLARSYHRLQTHLEAALKQEGLHGLDVLQALTALERDTGQITAKALEPALMMPQYGVSRLLDRMENDGLIKRVPDRRDKRIRHLHLTDSGRAALETMTLTRDAALENFLSPRAKPGQLDRMRDLLALLDQDLSNPTSG